MFSRLTIRECTLTLRYFWPRSVLKFAFCSLPYPAEMKNKNNATPINSQFMQE